MTSVLEARPSSGPSLIPAPVSAELKPPHAGRSACRKRLKQIPRQDGRMSQRRKPGPKPKPIGTRVRDHHSAVAKLPPQEWAKLEEIAAVLGVKPGRFVTDRAIQAIRDTDLNELRQQQRQEALPIAKAG